LLDEPESMITSKDNEKLKLIRKLAERKHREREGLFVAEGEDLVDAAAAAGRAAEFVLRAGEDVEPALLDSVSGLGSGTRVIGVYSERWEPAATGLAVYLHGVSDPGNVGAIIRTAHALVDSSIVLGPDCADPYSPKAVRASMGSVFAQPLVRTSVEATPAPRVALAAHGGGDGPGGEVATICLGAEREGLPEEVLAACDRVWTIPLAEGGAESLNVAAAAAIALGRISSAARGDGH
jgi:RNA methyltransferase, TrmH family